MQALCPLAEELAVGHGVHARILVHFAVLLRYVLRPCHIKAHMPRVYYHSERRDGNNISQQHQQYYFKSPAGPIPRIVLFHLSVSCLICYLMVLYTLFPDNGTDSNKFFPPEF